VAHVRPGVTISGPAHRIQAARIRSHGKKSNRTSRTPTSANHTSRHRTDNFSSNRNPSRRNHFEKKLTRTNAAGFQGSEEYGECRRLWAIVSTSANNGPTWILRARIGRHRAGATVSNQAWTGRLKSNDFERPAVARAIRGGAALAVGKTTRNELARSRKTTVTRSARPLEVVTRSMIFLFLKHAPRPAA